MTPRRSTRDDKLSPPAPAVLNAPAGALISSVFTYASTHDKPPIHDDYSLATRTYAALGRSSRALCVALFVVPVSSAGD